MAMESQRGVAGTGQNGKGLLEAIREGDQAVNTVLKLLREGVDVETEDENGTRALAVAAGLGRDQMVRTLLRFHAKIHINGEETKAPLVAASTQGHVGIVRLFKEGGIDERERLQSLLEAVRNRNLPIVKELLVLPADFTYETHEGSGTGFLAVAAESGQLDVVSFLLSEGAPQLSLKSRSISPLHIAAEKGHIDVVRLLVEQSEEGHASLSSLDPKGCTPLVLACFGGKSEVAIYLASKMDRHDLDARTDDHFSALIGAICSGDRPVVRRLLGRGADPNLNEGDHVSPLHLAAKTGLEEIANDLLKKNAFITVKDKRGRTPLHWAAASTTGHPLISFFIKNGADVNAQCCDGLTPLNLAVEYDSKASVESLLKHNADPNVATLLGITPLHEIAARGNADMLELLLGKGADVNALAFDMTKPIHLAASNWKSSIVRRLQTSHLDLSEIDGYGMNVREYTANHQHTLEDRGNPTDKSVDTATIGDLRSRTLSEIVCQYRDLCIKTKRPSTEERLIRAIISILLLKYETALVRRFCTICVACFKSRHAYELQFTCFKCNSKASFRELYRCMQCFPASFCAKCNHEESQSAGSAKCCGHELIQCFGEGFPEQPAIVDLDSILERILEKSKVVQSSDKEMRLGQERTVPVLSSVPYELVSDPTTASSASSSETRSSEEGTQLTQSIDPLIQKHFINHHESGVPSTSPFALYYVKFRHILVHDTLRRYRDEKSVSYTTQDLDDILAKTTDLLSLPSSPSPEWIQSNIALTWFLSRRIEDKRPFTSTKEYIGILQTFSSFVTTYDQLEDKSAIENGLYKLLADLHTLEYERSDVLKHLDDAIISKRKAIFTDLSINKKDSELYESLGTLLFRRYKKIGLEADIIESVDMLRTYCQLVAEPSEKRVTGLNNLACILHLRWIASGLSQRNLLDEAQTSLQEALQIAKQQNLSQLNAEMMNNWRNLRNDVDRASGTITQLDAELAAIKESLDEIGISPDTKAVRMNNLAYRLQLKQEQTTTYANIEEGMNVVKEALTLRGIKRHTTCLLLNTFSNLLLRKCRRSGKQSCKDWDLLIRISKVMVGSEPFFASRLKDIHFLSVVLADRYREFHDIRDLNEAIGYGLRCLRQSSVRNADRGLMLSALGGRFELLFERTKNMADLDTAVDLVEAAIVMDPSNEGAYMTLGISLNIRWSATGDRNNLHRAIDRFEECFRNSKFSMITRVKGAIHAGFCAMDLGEYARASDFLEGSVPLLPKVYQHVVDLQDWQYVMGSWTGLAEVIASARLLHNSQSAFEALRSMESARGLIASVVRNPGSHDRVGANPESIGTTSDEQSYMALAEAGPIVTFVVTHWQSSAIIVTSKGIRAIDLPNLKRKDLEEDAIKYVVGENATTKGSDDTHFVRNRNFKRLLNWLWKVAVKPVLQCLELYQTISVQSKLPRIWWISSGLMGLMPLHAAGTHSRGSRENTMSHVVSSYSPTFQSLRYSRQRVKEASAIKDPSVMVVAMPKTEGKRPLKVEDEINMLETAFSKPTVLRSPTENVVLETMRSHNIGHFICHGYSHPYNPSKSGLVLFSGTLTLETILKEYSPKAHIMYMSACSTAESSTSTLVDEVLHLGSGFQLVGFPHVIATLWEVDNKEATKVAKKFYSDIKAHKRNYLEEGIVARALHEAVRLQRDVEKDEDIFAWAAQVHYGP